MSTRPGWVSCRSWCADPEIGRTRFHVLTNALACARWDNKRAGRKVTRIAVINGHFQLVEVKP